jgi:co-chaperonin GroES (HSP10)
VEGLSTLDTLKGRRIGSNFNGSGGTEIKLDGKEYKIMSSDDILAVIE